MRTLKSILLWGVIAAVGAGAFGVIALSQGETINAVWLLVAAVCVYAVAYRFYSRFIARKVFGLDNNRQTPAHTLNDGKIMFQQINGYYLGIILQQLLELGL